MHDTGIASIGLKLPTLALHTDELARLRGIDPKKFTVGLGCEEMALCDEGWDAARLGAEAAERALTRWGGDRSRIGLVAVGTETAKDMSRPLSAFIMDALGMRVRTARPERYEERQEVLLGRVRACRSRRLFPIGHELLAIVCGKRPGEPFAERLGVFERRCMLIVA